MKRLKIFAWTAAALITLDGCENNFDPEIYGSLFPGIGFNPSSVRS